MSTAGIDSSPPTLSAVERRRKLLGDVLPVLVTLGYLGVMMPLVWRHVIWRDEAQAFLIARDSGSIREMLYNLRFEGHPPLWYLILHALTRITTAPAAMQWVHLGLATASVYLVSRYSPFSWVAKVLFPFGYYMLFEYGVVARNYQLLMLAGVLFCIAWKRRAYVWMGVALAVLCVSHAFGVILSAGLGVMVVADAVWRPAGEGGPVVFSRRFLVGGGIAVAGAVCGAITSTPAAGAAAPVPWVFDMKPEHVVQTLRALANAYMPWSPWELHFWDVSVFTDERAMALGTMAGLAAIACVARSWRAVVFLVVADLGLLAFYHVKFAGVWHHHGVLFIAWVLAVWICIEDGKRSGWGMGRWGWVAPGALMVSLASQVYGARVPAYYCWNATFTPARQVAELLRKEMGPGDVVMSDIAVTTAPVCAYMPGVKFYYVAEQRWGTFTTWDLKWWVGAGMKEIEEAAGEMRGHRVWLVHCSARGDIPGARKCGVFEAGVVLREEYTVFELGAGK